MKKRTLLILFGLAFGGCGGTSGGNALQPVSLNVEIGGYQNSALTELKTCFTQVKFFPVGSDSPVAVDLALIPTSLGASQTSVASITVPEGGYDRVELEMKAACTGADDSVEVTNLRGTFGTNLPAKMRFAGPFSVDATSTHVILDVEAIVNQLTQTSADGLVVLEVEARAGVASAH